ncbi:MAG: hypothetical protein D3910_26735, partial [Candidatus Electrothrix sp. ATG2]|nr:hypothetical protein [Candidatus Electrothrix sp. ATG2]
EHNTYSVWFDKLEQLFTDQRKLFHNIPLGLRFSWEFGNLTRRERAYFGEKLDAVQEWFNEGHSSRQFAVQNGNTDNWLVFYFSKLSQDAAHQKLVRLAKLKLIKEVHLQSFQFGVYGISFAVSDSYPPQLEGVNNAVMLGADTIEGQYTETDIAEAYQEWGRSSTYDVRKIYEFPD